VSFLPTRVPRSPRRRGEVVVTVDGTCLRGRALDLRGRDVSAERLLEAIHAASTLGPSRLPRRGVDVDCDVAGPAHEHVRRIPPRSFDLHAALVAAARSRGAVVPAVRRLERARAALVAVADDHEVGLAAAKRRVAAVGRNERRLAERVATLRGRLTALRDVGADPATIEAVETDLAEAVGTLTDVETERIAAEQRLARVERDARAVRDRRQRRLRLADRVANFRRRVRRDLVASVYDEFAAAVRALPGDAEPGDRPADYAGDQITAVLAVTRVARVDAPVVLAVDRFGSPAEAATRLDAPVVRLSGPAVDIG
jgi:hypothetical protein